MSNIYTSVSQLIGATPLIRLCNIEKKDHLHVTLLAKAEGFNPAGSAKDRVALSMIDDAEREIGHKLHMPICIHMDPIVTTDESTNRLRQQMTDFLIGIDPALSLHDFRVVPGQEHTNVIFDCVLPAGFRDPDMLLRTLTAYAHSLDERYQLVVQFDTDYT